MKDYNCEGCVRKHKSECDSHHINELYEEIVGLRKTLEIYEKALKRNNKFLTFTPNDSIRGTFVYVLSDEDSIILDGKEEFYKNNKSCIRFHDINED